MKTLTLTLATLSLTVVTACATTRAFSSQPVTPLKVESFTSDEAGFLVNSHVIEGKQEMILVDAQFTRSQARKVSELLRKKGKALKAIFITHGHPDHYFGLEILTRDFPKAAVLASAEVIADIQATAKGKQEYWKTIYKEDLTDSIVVPQVFNGSDLELEGQRIQVVSLNPGESEHANVLYLPSTGALLTGDLAYNGVHLWLAEDRPEAWLKNLADVRELGPIQKVLPGHGKAGGVEILKKNEEYIRNFLEVTAKAKDAKEAIAKIAGQYPQYRLPIILELSVKARVH